MNVRITNGGIAQGLMEAANEMGELSDKDKAHLDHLKSLPQDRMEINGALHEIPAHYYADKEKTYADDKETKYRF
jgi:hypothetical protein